MKKLIVILLLALATSPAFATDDSVVVLYDGNSEVNSETLRHCQAAFRQASTSVSLTNDASTIRPGEYDAVIALNTGYASDIDPAVQSFIESYNAPQEIILLSLQAGTNSVSVTVSRAADAQPDPDSLPDASTWPRERSTVTNHVITMHDQWVSELATLITENRT